MARRRARTGACGPSDARARLADARSRSENHADAGALLREVEPGGPEAAKQLDRLLAMKTESQYGFAPIRQAKLITAVRRARSLVEFAERALQR